MISQLLKSIAKSIRLRKISKAIVARPFSHEPLERLLDLCEGDQTIQFVMRSHGADREAIRALYISLVANGAGQWERGHYVAASALAFGTTLDYCLQADNMRATAFKCLDYFATGNRGMLD